MQRQSVNMVYDFCGKKVSTQSLFHRKTVLIYQLSGSVRTLPGVWMIL
jgi:hypothetical protein